MFLGVFLPAFEPLLHCCGVNESDVSMSRRPQSACFWERSRLGNTSGLGDWPLLFIEMLPFTVFISSLCCFTSWRSSGVWDLGSCIYRICQKMEYNIIITTFSIMFHHRKITIVVFLFLFISIDTPCFYSSSEETNQTLAPHKAFSVFSEFPSGCGETVVISM